MDFRKNSFLKIEGRSASKTTSLSTPAVKAATQKNKNYNSNNNLALNTKGGWCMGRVNSQPEKQGWLEKRERKKRKVWRRKWFILHFNALAYFDHPSVCFFFFLFLFLFLYFSFLFKILFYFIYFLLFIFIFFYFLFHLFILFIYFIILFMKK